MGQNGPTVCPARHTSNRGSTQSHFKSIRTSGLATLGRTRKTTVRRLGIIDATPKGLLHDSCQPKKSKKISTYASTSAKPQPNTRQNPTLGQSPGLPFSFRDYNDRKRISQTVAKAVIDKITTDHMSGTFRSPESVSTMPNEVEPSCSRIERRSVFPFLGRLTVGAGAGVKVVGAAESAGGRSGAGVRVGSFPPGR
jgi:hypothetical protein